MGCAKRYDSCWFEDADFGFASNANVGLSSRLYAAYLNES